MEGTTLNLKKCVRILSLLRHPLCVTVLTVQLELQVMTDLFSMYEVGIICLWTWHHWLVNSCKATQTFGRFFFLLPFLLGFQHWEMPLIKKSLHYFYLSLLSNSQFLSCMLLTSCPIRLSGILSMGFRGWCWYHPFALPTFEFFGCTPFPLSHEVNDNPQCS